MLKSSKNRRWSDLLSWLRTSLNKNCLKSPDKTPDNVTEKFESGLISLSNIVLWSYLRFIQSQQWKRQNNVGNQFKVNNKNTRATSMTSLCCNYC